MKMLSTIFNEFFNTLFPFKSPKSQLAKQLSTCFMIKLSTQQNNTTTVQDLHINTYLYLHS